MIHKIRQYYHQNKNKVRVVILIIVFSIIALQVMNYLSMRGAISKSQEDIIGADNNSTSEANNAILKNESVVTGEKVNNTILKNVNDLIQKFVDECNNGNIEKAYELLSSDCKNINYKSLQKFKELYYDKVFGESGNKNITIENWISNTYRVNFYNDIIETGKVSDKNTQDYITVVKENEDLKLNINSFVGVENINEEQEKEGVIFNIISKNIFMDYEEYTIKIQNKTDNKVLLDTQQNPKTIYLQDSKGIEYYASSNEIISNLLKVNNGFSTQVSIKFLRKYTSSSSKIEAIVFSDVILDIKDDKSKTTINIKL